MPLYEQDRAIREYWEEVKNLYPNISFEAFANICKSPFNFIKKCIRNDNLPIMLIKFLGKIRPFPTRIKRMIIAYKDKDDERSIERTAFLKEYLKELEIYEKGKDVD